jgi:hypothetical protein
MTLQPERSNVVVDGQGLVALHPLGVYRGPDDTSCPCSYCTAIRSGELAPVLVDESSPWLRRMGGMPAR